jgi:LacI family transcriptional regulator
VAKAATLYDVAQLAGVSTATVSDTFRRPHRVKPATQEVVKAAALALNYVPSGSARGLAHGRTGALGLFSFDYFLAGSDGPVPDPPVVAGGDEVRVVYGDEDGDAGRAFPLYVDEVQRGVELECRRRGYALLIGGGGHADVESVITDIAGRVDGLAVLPHTVPGDVLERISRRIPVVVLSEGPHGDDMNHVTVDNRGGMRAITDHLIVQHGLRDLVFVGRVADFDAKERLAGFRAALRAAGLQGRRKTFGPADTLADAVHIVDGLLDGEAMPEAFVCFNDEAALHMMDALAARSVAVPGRVAVTGFDGVLAGRFARPALTTVRQPMEAMGRAVVDILVDRLGHPEGKPAWRRLPVEVVVRESCGCPAR